MSNSQNALTQPSPSGRGGSFAGKRRILVVDDHPLVHRGLQSVVAGQSDLEICGQAADVSDALRLADQLQPDVAIVDLTLKGGHGFDLIRQLLTRQPQLKILVSSMHAETMFAERVLRAGAKGFISKHAAPEPLLEAIRCVARGDVWLSPDMTARVLARTTGQKALDDDPLSLLSDRELQVFELIGHGRTTQEIARELDVSVKTIETHRQNLKTKLGLRNSSELSRCATEWVVQGR